MLFLQNGNMIKNDVYKSYVADLAIGPAVKRKEKYKLINKLKCKDL